jgi:DNA-binding NtrC family response regulator
VHRGGEPVPLAVGQTFQIGKLSFMLLDAPHAASMRSEIGHTLRVIDPAHARVSTDVREIAKSGINVLVLGETGVGKEVLAETLHNLSLRRGPFVRISCAALPETQIERDLFGHEKAAFAGADESKAGLIAAAHRGTLLLDEVGELSSAVQAKLLRVIETKEVLPLGAVKPRTFDVRFIASSNRDLPADAARGRFRADLLYRLGVTLEIPPLRDRPQLIAPLAWQFLEEAERTSGRKPKPLPAEVLHVLEQHRWPGNVRELKAVIQRAALLARGRALEPQHVALDGTSRAGAAQPVATAKSSPAAGGDDERARIVAALEECAGNQTRVARMLGISRTTLVHKIALHQIPRPRK